MYSDDDRVALMGAEKVMVWSWGKPPDYDPREDRPAIKIDTSIMSPEEWAMLLRLFRKGLLRDTAEPEAVAEPAAVIEGQVERR